MITLTLTPEEATSLLQAIVAYAPRIRRGMRAKLARTRSFWEETHNDLDRVLNRLVDSLNVDDYPVDHPSRVFSFSFLAGAEEQ